MNWFDTVEGSDAVLRIARALEALEKQAAQQTAILERIAQRMNAQANDAVNTKTDDVPF